MFTYFIMQCLHITGQFVTHQLLMLTWHDDLLHKKVTSVQLITLPLIWVHYKCLPLHEFARISVNLRLFTPVYIAFTWLSHPYIHAWKLGRLRHVNTTITITYNITGFTWMTAAQQWAKVTFSFYSTPYFIITFPLTHFLIYVYYC